MDHDTKMLVELASVQYYRYIGTYSVPMFVIIGGVVMPRALSWERRTLRPISIQID